MKEIIKSIYNLIPFKQQIFSLLKTVWSPKENTYRHLHFKGVFNVKINASKNFNIRHYGFQLENKIFWEGIENGWEKESTKLWIKLCERSNVIVDIGANTGIYSLIAKAMNPSSKVYAFEPVERVFDKLQANIALNNFAITAVQKAASDKDGTAIIYDTKTDHVYSVTVNKNLSDGSIEVVEKPIETITLNSFVKEHQLQNIDLLKIDVETHEPEVLEGFDEYLSVFKPILLIEILNDEVGEKVQNMIKNLDYLFFNIDEDGGIRQVNKINKSDYYNYLLCNEKVARELKLIP